VQNNVCSQWASLTVYHVQSEAAVAHVANAASSGPAFSALPASLVAGAFATKEPGIVATLDPRHDFVM
jgi:hypothetical protein